MRFQIRLMAVLRSLNFTTGVTPGSPFQVATSLAVGHWAATSAKFCSLAKAVERRGAGRRGFRRAGEYRNVVIVVNRKGFHYPFLLWATLCAVITWITRNRMKGKGILTKKKTMVRRR